MRNRKTFLLNSTPGTFLPKCLSSFLFCTLLCLLSPQWVQAQQVLNWSQTDLGNTGSYSVTSGSYTINGAGTGIPASGTTTSDNFNFVSQPTVGDMEMIVYVSSQSSSASGTAAGIAIRDSVNANAGGAFVTLTPSSGVNFTYRASDGAAATTSNLSGVSAPTWLRLVRTGNNYSAYQSANGTSWMQVGSTQTLTLPASSVTGFAVCSGSSSLNTAVINQVTLLTGGTQVDIGNTGATGTYSYTASTSTRTIAGAGAGQTGSADAFDYVSYPSNGSVSFTAYVSSFTGATSNGLAGLTVRDSNNTNGAEATIGITPSAGIEFISRLNAGTPVSVVNQTGTLSSAPIWLRLTQSGPTWTGWYSSNGTSWINFASGSVTLPSSFLVGFATYSGGTSLATATYSNITLTEQLSFTQQDVGNSGSFALTYAISGAGAGLSGTSDSFSYVAMPTSGDVAMTVHVASQSASPSGAVAGIMARYSSNANAAHAFVGVTAGGNVQFTYRTTNGGSTTTVAGTTDTWLRLTQSGSTFTAYQSSNGTSWSSIGSASITMPSGFFEGLAVSGSSGTLSNATFDNISLGQIGDLAQTDIGSPGATGTFGQTYTLEGDGTGVVGTTDNFNYTYIPSSGNVEMITKISNLQNPMTSPSNYAAAGLMMRDSLLANGAMAMVTVSPAIGGSPGNGVNFTYRTTDGGTVNKILGPSLATPIWLRLTRSGSDIAGYQSSDGINWTLVGNNSITMPNNTYIGVAVSSNSAGNLETATLTSVEYMINVPQRSSSLSMWLRGDVGVTSSSNQVSLWSDQSTNGNNAFQNTSSQQPTLSSAALSGMPVMNFNGSSQSFQLGTDFTSLSSGASMLMVAKPVSVTAASYLIDFANSASSDNIILGVTTGSASVLTTYRGASSAALTSSSGGANVGQWQILEGSIDSSNNATLYNNGTQFGSGAVLQLNNIARASNFIGQRNGGTGYFNGQVAEMLFFNAPITSTQRKALQSYFFSKYGAGTMPALSTPTITPGFGVYGSPQIVTITSDPGSQIFYTLDGSPPTSASIPYSGTFVVSATTTVNAIAIEPYYSNSTVASAQIVIDPGASAVTLPGLYMWFRSDTGVQTSGSNVTQWNDIGGSGRNATQSSSPAQPTFVSNAVNGLPALSFDGSTQYLQLPSGFANFTSGLTMFVVANPNNPTLLGHRMLDFEDSSGNNLFCFNEYSSSGLQFLNINGGTATSLLASGVLTTGVYQVIENLFDGSTTDTIYINGTQQAQSTSMNSIANTNRINNYICNNSTGAIFPGSVAEIIMYNAALSTSQRQGIENYLLARYGIQVNPPVISPSTGMYATTPQTVTITVPTDVTAYYTTDGTTPTTSSPTYAGPFIITQSTTVQSFAKAGTQTSSVSRADIAIDTTAGNVPTSGLTLWLRNDVGITKSGSSVSAWADISNSGNGATQSTSGDQPTFTSSGGINCVNFNGSSQFLSLPSGFANYTSGASAFIVTAPTSVTTNARWLDLGTGSSGNNNFYLSEPTNTGAQFTVYSSTSGQTVTSSSAINLGAFQVLEAIQNGSSTGTIWTNSTQGGTGSLYNIPNVSRTANFIGQATQGGTYFTGNIAELILFNRPVSSFEQAVIEAYIMTRYSLFPSYPTPIMYPAGGTHFSGSLQVAITAATGATIYYTTNGTTPTTSSPTYAGPITLTTTTTVKAISALNSVISSVSSATYTTP